MPAVKRASKKHSRRVSKKHAKKMSKKMSKKTGSKKHKLAGGAKRMSKRRVSRKTSRKSKTRPKHRRNQKGGTPLDNIWGSPNFEDKGPFDLRPLFFNLSDPKGIQRNTLIAKNYYFAQFILEKPGSLDPKDPDQKYLIFNGQVTDDFIKKNIFNNDVNKTSSPTYFDQMIKVVVHAINNRIEMIVPLKRDLYSILKIYNTKNQQTDSTDFIDSPIKFLTIAGALK
jgi:hypothetical protein